MWKPGFQIVQKDTEKPWQTLIDHINEGSNIKTNTKPELSHTISLTIPASKQMLKVKTPIHQ